MEIAALAKIAAGATAAIAAPMLVVNALGFGAAGVAVSSVAAGVQSSIGCVQAGSLFATLQSVGAAGFALGTKAALGVGGAISGALL